jgi:hypothetical protein
MLLRLVLGSGLDGHYVEAGTVLRWHKSEGEQVDYGDDVCDLVMNEYRAPKGLLEVEKERGQLSNEPAKLADLMARLLEGERPVMPTMSADSFVALKGPEFVLRLTACDRGTVRRIEAPAGAAAKAGDVLAVLTTDPTEPLGESAETASGSTLFRFVENVLWQTFFDDDDLFSMKW